MNSCLENGSDLRIPLNPKPYEIPQLADRLHPGFVAGFVVVGLLPHHRELKTGPSLAYGLEFGHVRKQRTQFNISSL